MICTLGTRFEQFISTYKTFNFERSSVSRGVNTFYDILKVMLNESEGDRIIYWVSYSLISASHDFFSNETLKICVRKPLNDVFCSRISRSKFKMIHYRHLLFTMSVFINCIIIRSGHSHNSGICIAIIVKLFL